MYSHIVLEGSHYEIGKIQGQRMKSKPGFVKWFTAQNPQEGAIDDRSYAGIRSIFEEHCPGINEEIEGIADELGVSPQTILYYTYSCTPQGSCSQFALLPKITENGHCLVGRSYEWNTEDDFTLCTTRVSGKAAHIGFTLLSLGRIDGINEHGLCVTMSAGAPMRPVSESGLKFWALIRTLLENCRNVDEALERIKNCPVSFFLNLIVADRSGSAALVEIAESRRAVKRIDASSDSSFVFATNQFTLEGMVHETPRRMWQSLVRYKAIERRIGAAQPKVGIAQIKSLLSDKMPDGLTCHHYSETLGTLWSMIFDLNEGAVDVCMGSPQLNPWRRFDLDPGMPAAEYSCKLPDEAADPAIFRHLEADEQP